MASSLVVALFVSTIQLFSVWTRPVTK